MATNDPEKRARQEALGVKVKGFEEVDDDTLQRAVQGASKSDPKDSSMNLEDVLTLNLKDEPRSETVAIRVKRSTMDKLAKIKRKTGASPSHVINDLLEKVIDKLVEKNCK